MTQEQKPRKRWVDSSTSYGVVSPRPRKLRPFANHRNKHTGKAVPDLTPEQFEQLFAQVGSLRGMIKVLEVSETRLYQMAHRLFPGRAFKTGPKLKFHVEEVKSDIPGKMYRIRKHEEPSGSGVPVHWDGQAARCQLCFSRLRATSSSCTHARSVRRYALEARTNNDAVRPCDKCPWTERGQPLLDDELRQAAVDGRWFCCHVRLGTCIGAANYGRAKRGYSV